MEELTDSKDFKIVADSLNDEENKLRSNLALVYAAPATAGKK